MVALISNIVRIITLTALVPLVLGSALPLDQNLRGRAVTNDHNLRGRAVSIDHNLRGRAVSTDQNMRGRAVSIGQTWEEYDQTNVAFAHQGLCRHYWDTPTRHGEDGVWPCRQYCRTDEDNNYVCRANNSGDPSAFLLNPDGQRYSLGTCECNDAFVYRNSHGRRGGIEGESLG